MLSAWNVLRVDKLDDKRKLLREGCTKKVIAQDLGGEGIWVLPVLHSYSGHRTGVNSPCTASECLTGQEQFLRSENFSNAYGVGGFDLEVVSRQPSARICS
ncbi:MAG: hypothetical protein GDA56_08695 [Hormoscilla sp. GM7CHS1pb]|nr:hypothetical protein [Hormoscilla sp. GM7CHS1pb]